MAIYGASLYWLAWPLTVLGISALICIPVFLLIELRPKYPWNWMGWLGLIGFAALLLGVLTNG